MASVSDKTIVNEEQKSGRIVLQGYHKKLKTMKKKYFVLYDEDGNSSARLEYFDNEKKFKSNSNSRRTIVLSDCFNINRRVDPKHEFVITLSNKDGCFGIVMEKEEDINTWLKAMLKLQSDQNKFLNPPKIFYEHVWQVVVQRKGLAESKGILGRYHVCLSPKSVTFIRIGNERTNTGEKRVTNIEFYLTSIRRCGDSKCYFYLEVGRQSVVGAGELWMETKDSLIAQNMHTMILNVMSSNAEDSYGPMRKRSSSATESTKPVTIQRRPTLNFSPLSGATNRGRCDSLPSSRNRTAPESGYNTFSNSSVPPSKTMSSLYSAPNSISYRPSVDNYAFVSSSMGFSESDGSTISIDEPDSAKISHTSIESTAYVTSFQNSCSPSGEVILEENCDEFCSSGNKPDEFDKSASVLDTSNIHKNTTQNEDDGKLLSSCSNIYSADSESQYMDMFDSSLMRESATYDNTIAETELTSKLSYQSSGGNSRASSVTEETFDYVQMSPQTLTDYVDMEQSLKNKRQVGLPSNRNIMPEMPFKNMCFTNYALKKVNSGILADDDETQLKNQRPLRTYSVGSRMEHNNQKLRIELMTNVDRNNCRVRAFSVGSKSKIPKCDLQRNVLKMANSAKTNNSNFSNSKVSITNIEPIIQSAADRKSSSAPHLIHKIQNSADRMGDHMEIDFSKNSDSRSNSFSLHPEPPTTRLTKVSKESGLVNNASAGQNVISKKSNEAITSAEDYGYLEMRPIIYNEGFSNTEKNVTNLVSNNIESRHQSQDSRNNKIIVEEKDRLETPDGYLEMSWNGNKDYPVLHQNTSNYTNLVDDNFNISIKPQPQPQPQPYLSNMKNLKTLNKMTPVTTSHQYSSTGNSSNFLTRSEVTPKSELNQNKSFSRHNNSSYTISEEKTTGIEHVNVLEKFNDLLISRKLPRRNAEDLPNVYVDLSSVDSDCYKYINFDPKISEQINSPKAVKENIFDTKAAKDDNGKDHLLDESKKITRKSNYNITPSKHLSLTNCQSLGNKNQATNNSGYELLHISSDSSLQGKTFQCLSKSRSAKNNKHFALDSDTFQINSANNDIFQHKHVSPASTPRFHPLMIQLSCDNSAQDRLLAKENSSTSESTVYDKSQSPMDKEFKLHYASLDLPATSTTHAPTKCSSFDVTSKCLSPDAKAVQQSALEYAKIDFKQCEIQQCKMGE